MLNGEEQSSHCSHTPSPQYKLPYVLLLVQIIDDRLCVIDKLPISSDSFMP